MLVVRSRGQETVLFHAITSQTPRPDTLAVEIPEIEAKRARVYVPAWVIVDEFNIDDIATKQDYNLVPQITLAQASRPKVAW